MSVVPKNSRKEKIPDEVLAAFGQKNSDVPADVLAAFGESKKKEQPADLSSPSIPSLSASASAGASIESIPQSTSQSPSPSVAAAPTESPFEFKKYQNKKFALPANIPRAEGEVSKVLSKVENGVVDKEDLSELYSLDYGKPIVENIIKTYAPQLGEAGWDKGSFRNEEKWDELSKIIKTQNRTNATVKQAEYITTLDAELQEAVQNLRTTKINISGGTGGAAVNENNLPFPQIDLENPWEYGRLVEQLRTSDGVIDAEGKRLPGKKEQLIKALEEKAKYYTSKQGISPEIEALGDKVSIATTRANMNREIGESIPTEEYAKNDKLTEAHFKIGLSYLKNVQPGQYKNIMRVLDEGKSLPDDDFRNVSEVGQEIYNQKIFFDAASNPELIDKETAVDYTTRSDKKAQYAAIIGERLKKAVGSNIREYTEDEIKKAAFDLPNKSVVQELANEEKIFGYDAIPKSGVVASFVQGVNQPLNGIRSTFELFSESPVETYIRSKKLDIGSSQKVVGEDGQVSEVLPSDRGNVFYDMVRGLGQFVPQVLLTKGIGGAANTALGTTGRVAADITNYGGTAVSTFIQSYGDSYADYLQKTGDHATARLGATVDAGSAAAFELVLPDVKLADKALSGLKRGLSSDIIDLVKKGGDPAELAAKARPFVQKFVTNAVNITGQEVAEETGTQLVDYITEAVFSPQTVKDRDLGKEMLETVKATAVSMAIPSLLGAAGSSVRPDFTKSTFNAAAINFDEYRQALDKQLNNDAITQNDYNAAIKLLTTHKGSIDAAPRTNINGAPVPSQQQLDYAYEDTKIKVYKEKAQNSDGVAKEMWESKIKQSEDIQREILMPKDSPKSEAVNDFSSISLNRLEVDETPNTLSPQETILKAVNDGNVEGVEFDLVKAGTITADEALLSLAKQKHGVSDDGSVFPEGGRDISLKTSLDIDEAVDKLYPNQQAVVDAIKQQTTPTEGNVVPSGLKDIEVGSGVEEGNRNNISSVLKNETGTPLTLYHGTSRGVTVSQLKQSGQAGDYGVGVYFTTDKREAEQRNSENVLEVNVDSEKHLVVGSNDYFDGIYKELEKDYGSVIPRHKIGEYARAAGYTSMEVERPEGKWVIVFDDSSIKSPQTTPQVNAPASVSVVTPQQNVAPNLGTRVQTSEPPAVEGVTPVTLSGLTETERQQRVQKRAQETNISAKQKQTNDLLQKVKSYNSLPNGRLGKQRPAGLQALNNIRLEASKLGYSFDERAGTLKNENGKTVRPDNRAVGDRAIISNAVPLRERDERTQDVFNQLLEAGQFPNGYRLDNKQMSAAELDGAIQDILDGIPSERAESYLNQIEKYIAADSFEIGNPGELKLAPKLNDLLGVTSETQTQPMTEEALEAWLNEQGELTPEQEQTVIDNIENLIQDYEPATPDTGNVLPAQPAAETTASPAVEQNTEPINTQTEAAQIAESEAQSGSVELDPVQSLTDELRSLLGNDALPFTGDTNPQNRVSFEDLGITPDDTIETAIDKLIAYGGQYTDLFNLIKADPAFKNIQLQLVNNRRGLDNGESGLYYPVGYGEGMDGTLQIANKDNVYYTAAHELMHFMTLDSDTANSVKDSPSYKAIVDMYNYIADKKGKPVAIAGGATMENYGLTNEKEFLAELLINPTFRNYVRDVFATNKDDIFKASQSIRDSKVNSIGDIIYNLFKDIFQRLFARNNNDVAFDKDYPVVMNAAKIATDLFFGGQDIISTQPTRENTEGATVLSMGQEGSRAAALALPSTNVSDKINSFVKAALGRGMSESDIKQAMLNNGISEADAQSYIDSNKPQSASTTPASSTQTRKATDGEVISRVVNQRIDAKTFPTIFDDNETKKQQAAETQGAGQNREVDGSYVVALHTDLRDISIQSAKVLRDELGADWGEKTLSWMEQNPSSGNVAQVVGLLNVMSTENFQAIQDTHDGNKVRKLQAIQRRIDVVSNQRARDSSLALNQRVLYAKFAQGEDIVQTMGATLLSPELKELQRELNAIVSEPVTDQEVNAAPPLRSSPPPKKKTSIRNILGAAKKKSNPAVREELINAGIAAANKTKKTFKELVEEAKAKLNNVKC